MCHFRYFVFLSFVVLDVMTFPDYVVFVFSSFQCKDVKMFCRSMFSLAPDCFDPRYTSAPSKPETTSLLTTIDPETNTTVNTKTMP